MADIITLADETRLVVEDKIREFENDENKLNKEIVYLDRSKLQLEAKVEKQTGQDKKDTQSAIKKYKADVKLLQQELDLVKAKRKEAEQKLAKMLAVQTDIYITKNTQDSVLKTFQDSNIHYVISGREWWRIEQDYTGDIRIRSHDYQELKDLVFLATDWEIKDEMEVKRFAKEHNRLFKDIVRDFTTKAPGIYNQMHDIRKMWMKPADCDQPHPAFLMMS
jgi:seryl-tRNA synthetase